ncbi:hypothetical protein RRG08_066703, partial [Elysia crispata]
RCQFLSVMFCTTPMDSPGGPHISEYPVLWIRKVSRIPFFKILSRSMAIFIYVFINRWADIKVSSHKIYYQLTFSVNFVTQCFPAVKSTHTRGYAHNQSIVMSCPPDLLEVDLGKQRTVSVDFLLSDLLKIYVGNIKREAAISTSLC